MRGWRPRQPLPTVVGSEPGQSALNSKWVAWEIEKHLELNHGCVIACCR